MGAAVVLRLRGTGTWPTNWGGYSGAGARRFNLGAGGRGASGTISNPARPTPNVVTSRVSDHAGFACAAVVQRSVWWVMFSTLGTPS
jgi:hypothetical protein